MSEQSEKKPPADEGPVERPVRPLHERLQACIDDPMWADHAEVPKTLLRQTLEELALVRAAMGVAYGYLWLVNNEPGTPNRYPPEKAAYQARNALIPFRAKLDLWQISQEGERWHEATGRQPFFNYCAHEGNTSYEDALRIFRLFNPSVWQATISVVCERDESVAAANARQRKLATDFMEKLAHYGYSTRCFDPAGQDDIGGGCGQLWFVQDWMRQHPTLARPSIGRGIAVVHAPRAVA